MHKNVVLYMYLLAFFVCLLLCFFSSLSNIILLFNQKASCVLLIVLQNSRKLFKCISGQICGLFQKLNYINIVMAKIGHFSCFFKSFDACMTTLSHRERIYCHHCQNKKEINSIITRFLFQLRNTRLFLFFSQQYSSVYKHYFVDNKHR